MNLSRQAETPWRRCPDCGKIVKINKPLIGSTHICLSDEERAAKAAAARRRYG